VETAAQVAVVVSKRRFKRAVDRNAIKRKMREAYRLQKQMIGEHPNTTLQMCWIYIGKEIPAMETLFKAAVALFEKINNAIMEGEQ
jgi:ribonuclease P protein component